MTKAELDAEFGPNSENNPYRLRVEAIFRKNAEEDRALLRPYLVGANMLVFVVAMAFALNAVSAAYTPHILWATLLGLVLIPLAFALLLPLKAAHVIDGDTNFSLADDEKVEKKHYGGVDDPVFYGSSLYILPGMSCVIDDDDD